MLVEQFANRLKTNPEKLERDALRFFLSHQLHLIGTELFALARRYGVKTVLDSTSDSRGKVQRVASIREYFRFDYSRMNASVSLAIESVLFLQSHERLMHSDFRSSLAWASRTLTDESPVIKMQPHAL